MLFYHPKEDILDRKLRNIGLCEAIINFTKSFSPGKPCEAIHTLKTRQVLLEAEPDIWMSMVRPNYRASPELSIKIKYCEIVLGLLVSQIVYNIPKG